MVTWTFGNMLSLPDCKSMSVVEVKNIKVGADFKNDKGEEIHCIANIAFSTDSEHQERYVEYVYDLSDVDLTQYKVYGYFVTSDTHIEGNWSVTFPLESISQ